MLSRLTVSKRLAGGFAVVGLLLALIVGVALQTTSGLTSNIRSVADHLDTTHDALEVKFRSADLNGWQTAYAFDVVQGVTDATNDAVGSRKSFLDSAAAVRTEIAALEARTLTGEESAFLAKATTAFDRFMELDAKVIQAYRTGDAAQVARGNEWVAKDEIVIFTAMAEAIDGIVKAVDQDSRTARSDADASGSRARTLLLAGGIVALALAVVLARTITRSITKPIEQLRERLTQIADGDGDLTQRLDEDRRDELGAVGAAFNRFVGKICGTIRQIADHSVVIASASEELSAVSKQMAGNADNTARQATNSSAAAEEVSASVQTVAAATEEMTTAIAEIARGASDAANVAAKAGMLAEAAQETMISLGNSSTQIDEVAHLIGGIAEQTNLLALNATIEAARAGEAGKGFAVVATEVKDLATRSGGATADISRQIATIQADVHAAVSSITDIVQVIDQINETFATIATAVEEQTATTGEISRNLVQVSTGAEAIAHDVSRVARSAAEATQGANDTENAAVELSSLAGDLQSLVGQFRY